MANLNVSRVLQKKGRGEERREAYVYIYVYVVHKGKSGH